MLALIAAFFFAIAALIAFTPLSGISVIGLIAAGLFFLALAIAFSGPIMPRWRRT